MANYLNKGKYQTLAARALKKWQYTLNVNASGGGYSAPPVKNGKKL